MKKYIYIYLLVIFLPAIGFSLGQTEESDYKQVSGKDNWEYEVPLEGKEPGEYNLLIRAKDKANNEVFTGPFDIFVDPESDLPLVSITNPSSFMRVGGNLNIVGTARDDDSVDKVLIKVNDGEFEEVVGTQFWSYFLSADKVEDGQHTITAKAVDINGLEGREVSVTYNQDTLKPTNTIENYSNGVIFSGKVNIKGKVVDANGIKNISLSTDDQKSYNSIKFEKDKTSEFYFFDIDIDTRKLEDGPNIYWIKSDDKTGSTAYTAFLFFVDNIGPEITIIDPVEKDILNGRVSLSGKISDKIGIKSFKYIYNEVEKEITLKAGNPYWTTNIDFSAENKIDPEIVLITEDTSGNSTELKYKFNIDRESDKPLLNITSPLLDTTYKEDLIIEGYVTDDDYVKGISYTLDGDEPVVIETFNSFSKTLENLSSGSHTVKLRAIDSNDLYGDEIEIPFVIDGKSPEILLENLKKGESEIPFTPGINVTTDGGYSINGKVLSGNNIVSLKYKIGRGDFIELPLKKSDNIGETKFAINIDSSFFYGVLDFTIYAKDEFGNEVSKESNIYVKNYSVVNENWGLSYASLPGRNNILLRENKPFTIYFNGPDIKSVESEPKSDVIKINNDTQVITISSGKEGRVEDLKFIVNTDKGVYETTKFNFSVDVTNPIIVLDNPKLNSNQSTALAVSGSIKETLLSKLEYRYSNEEGFKDIKFSGTTGDYSFRTTLDIPVVSSESLSIELQATDNFGNSSTISRSFGINENKFVQTLLKEELDLNSGKSSDKPVLEVNYPQNNEVFFDKPLLSGFTRDDDSIKSIKVSDGLEGGKEITVATNGFFDIPLTEFGEGSKTLYVTAIDINGVESKSKKISYTFQAKKSSINIKRYREEAYEGDYNLGVLINREPSASLIGSVLEDINGDLSYRINDDPLKKIEIIDGSFTINLPKGLPWGRNEVLLTYTDMYGREESFKSFFFIVDKININGIKDELGLYFSDERLSSEYIDLGSNKPLIGYFNGRSIKDITLEAEKGTVPDFIEVKNRDNTIIIDSKGNGISKGVRVVVTTVDNDIFYSNFFKFIKDDFSPEIELETLDNQFIRGSINLIGRIKDNLKVSSLSYSINSGITWQDLELAIPKEPVKKEKYTATSPLDNIKVVKEEPKEFIFTQEVDFSNRADGGYSIWIKGVDLSGREVVKKISFIKDNTNPEISLFIPGNDEINGVITLIGKSKDNIELDSISYSKDEKSFTPVVASGVFNFDIDFGEDEVFPETFVIRALDKAGNYKDIYPLFNINREGDKPVVQIQTPINKEIIRNDFIISGMVFDDDGVGEILYSLDGGDLYPIAKNENNFSVNIPLESITNNEHTITVKAVDVLGVESDVVTSTFWVSKEEPTSNLILPSIDDTKNGTIKLVGTSFDENGIDSVYVSTDNGVSYQKAQGKDNWTYNFNTKNIKDGTYSLFVKAIDKLKTEGFYSTLINIDNTPPELVIIQPVDGDILSDKIVFSGRSSDNIGLKRVDYKIYTHTQAESNNIVVGEGNLTNNGIFNIDIPLEGFEPGEYNIELIAYDKADNRSISTRNFTVTPSDNAGDIELLFPQPGSNQTGVFEISGKILGFKPVDFVECFIDGELFSEIKVNEFNYFNLKVNTRSFKDGEHTISLKGTLEDGQVYDTPNYTFNIQNSGAWLEITNMKTGENISGRPFLTGKAGYIGDESITPILVEVSLDNGQIFHPAVGQSSWEFRVETWQYEDGLTPILVRSKYSNGESKTSRVAVNIDRTDPTVSVIEDLEMGRFNDSIKMSGTAFDSNGLTDISVILRDGSKSNYEVPGLFQGMFIDIETGYGKLYGTGIGFTFFDDNVKLQFTYGETRTSSIDARIKGAFYGGKLLANIYTLEYGAFLGPDFSPFSSSLAFGASFTNKTLSVSDMDSIMWYSAVVSQLEFIKVKFDSKYISSLSLYLDFEATLISSENTGGFFPRLGIGSRITLF
ncbi:Ig-like domain-containing protein [Thiospirochaeta perfilievii]|nr:Ig-like domain-containing protein [Thiospirochaeta perfilievii]